MQGYNATCMVIAKEVIINFITVGLHCGEFDFYIFSYIVNFFYLKIEQLDPCSSSIQY